MARVEVMWRGRWRFADVLERRVDVWRVRLLQHRREVEVPPSDVRIIAFRKK